MVVDVPVAQNLKVKEGTSVWDVSHFRIITLKVRTLSPSFSLPSSNDNSDLFTVQNEFFVSKIAHPQAVFDSVKQKMFAKVLINKTINFSFFIEPERNMNYEVRTKV